MDWTIIITAIIGIITSVLAWFGGLNKQRNDAINDMQNSINMLADENKKLMAEIIELRKENAKLRIEVEELNEKLSNIKTITKTKQ